ncbi:MAG: hypothetical protein ABI718_15155 [Acidobacteriota bacterium]
MRKTSVLLLLLAFAAPMAWAQNLSYKYFLVPIALPVQGIPGANGSVWTSHFLLRNDASESVSVIGFDIGCGGISLCPPPRPIPPGLTFAPLFIAFPPLYMTWLGVDERFVEQVSLSLRVQDVTRQGGHFGTRVPVVPESEFRTTIYLTGVPTTSAYRSLVRIYGVTGGRFRLRYYAIDSTKPYTNPPVGADRVLGTSDYEFDENSPPYSFALAVGVPEFGEPLVAITVEALDGEKIWAFASVTHNETQNVTIVAP